MPPTLTVDIEYLQQSQVRVFGQVTAPDPEMCTVYVTGVAWGSMTPDASGNFTMEVTGESVGAMEVYAVDYSQQDPVTGEYLTSEIHDFQLTSNIPDIVNFSSRYIGSNVWEVSGSVVDESHEGLIVTFDGMVPSLWPLTATVEADGSFILVWEIEQGEEGWVDAHVTDWWGLEAEPAMALIRSTNQ